MRERFEELDGLRGWAALFVVFGHFLGSFYVRWGVEHGQTGFVPWLFHRSFIELFLANGEFNVCIFFILSGFVLTNRYFRKADYNTVNAIARRYFRLALPILASVLLAYTVIKLHLHFNQQASALSGSSFLADYYKFPINFVHAINQALYDVFIGTPYTNQWYNPVLWTMRIELLGSLLVFGLVALMGPLKNRLLLYIILLTVLSGGYYLLFIIGMLLADLEARGSIGRLSRREKILITIVSILAFQSVYTLLGHSRYSTNVHDKINILAFGALGAVALALTNRHIASVLSSRFSRWIGRISYPVYLVHFTVLMSFSSYLYIVLRHHYADRIAVPILLFATFAAVLIIAHVFAKYIDEPAMKVARYAGNILLEPSILIRTIRSSGYYRKVFLPGSPIASRMEPPQDSSNT